MGLAGLWLKGHDPESATKRDPVLARRDKLVAFRQCCAPRKCCCYTYRKITWRSSSFMTASPVRSADCAAKLRCLRVLGGIRCRQRSQHYFLNKTASASRIEAMTAPIIVQKAPYPVEVEEGKTYF